MDLKIEELKADKALEVVEEIEIEDEIRAIALYGCIDEERAAEVVSGIVSTYHSGIIKDDEGRPTKKSKALDFYISTHGGDTEEMFAVYDIMRKFRDDMPINTFGIGKVMSAGILLLAAGEKGERKIGESCRLMLHSIVGRTSPGTIHRISNDVKEFKWTQQQYIKLLARETYLSEKEIKRLLSKKIDIYFDAEKALEYGIADIII